MKIELKTNFPLAIDSPDHIQPVGTKNDNNTSQIFINLMDFVLKRDFPNSQLGFMDLGCSGGQLVIDFSNKGYTAVGLEGSNYSIINKRANWPAYHNINLFTCDITKPFKVLADDQPFQANLITMWDVLEHIHIKDLPLVFHNIVQHLKTNGYFIATTADEDAVYGGIQLHQTKWTDAQWKQFMAKEQHDFVPVNLGITPDKYVRWNGSPGRGFLCYKKIS